MITWEDFWIGNGVGFRIFLKKIQLVSELVYMSTLEHILGKILIISGEKAGNVIETL
jgi:hypothetical protein